MGTPPTLRDQDNDTVGNLSGAVRALAVAVLLTVLLVDGDPIARIMFAGAMVVALLVGAIVESRVVLRGASSKTSAGVLATVVVPPIAISVLYFGVLSPIQLVPALGVHVFARRASPKWALAAYVALASAEAFMAIALLTGLVGDPGILDHAAPVDVTIAGHVLVQLGLFGAFRLGTAGRRASIATVAALHEAAKLASQREALLHEARHALDHNAAADGVGRLTDHVVGQYRLGRIIGRGGMGEVYEGADTVTAEAVAVKMLVHRELGNRSSVERFLREVSTARSLTSPHAVRVLAASQPDDPIPYLVMELLRGHDLSHHLRSGPMAHDVVLRMLDHLGAALKEAWGKGIVHRDLKPQNVFLCDDGSWKVLDFGVASLDYGSGTLTQGGIVGTPSYMSPEQARGERVDQRADVYALAAIAYRCLTGRPVFSSNDPHQSIYQTVHTMPERPTKLAKLKSDVDAVFAIGLAKDASDRWATAGELRRALGSALAGELDPALRQRADELIARHPWGATR